MPKTKKIEIHTCDFCGEETRNEINEDGERICAECLKAADMIFDDEEFHL